MIILSQCCVLEILSHIQREVIILYSLCSLCSLYLLCSLWTNISHLSQAALICPTTKCKLGEPEIVFRDFLSLSWILHFFLFHYSSNFFSRHRTHESIFIQKHRRICLLLSTNKLLMCIAIVLVHDIIAPLKMGIKRCWLDLNLLRCNWSHCCPRRLCVTTEFVQNVRRASFIS